MVFGEEPGPWYSKIHLNVREVQLSLSLISWSRNVSALTLHCEPTQVFSVLRWRANGSSESSLATNGGQRKIPV